MTVNDSMLAKECASLDHVISQGRAVAAWEQNDANGGWAQHEVNGVLVTAAAPAGSLPKPVDPFSKGRIQALLTAEGDVPSLAIQGGESTFVWVEQCHGHWREVFVSTTQEVGRIYEPPRVTPEPGHVNRKLAWYEALSVPYAGRAAGTVVTDSLVRALGDSVHVFAAAGLCTYCGGPWCR